MVNRKAFGLAAAITFLVPLGVAGDDIEDILTYSARVVYELTDIDGVPIMPNLMTPEIPIGQEQIVEGHTVFHTMEMVKPPPPPPKELNLLGLVECRYEVLGVALDFSHIDRIYVECNVGGRVYLSESNKSSPLVASDLAPTGWRHVTFTPDTRAPVVVTEYEYESVTFDEWGRERRERAFAWETTIVPEGTNPATGKPYNFVAALNMDRIRALGADRLQVWVGDEAAELYHDPSLPLDSAFDSYGESGSEGVQAPREPREFAGWDETTGEMR